MLIRFLLRLVLVLVIPALSGVLAALVLAPILDRIGLPPESPRGLGVAIGVVVFIVVSRRDEPPSNRVEIDRRS